jgi:ABC-type transport system involved in multi-copper enzyme maturation permease subunit
VNPLRREVRFLIAKEMRQWSRNPGAFLSSVILAMLLVGIAPVLAVLFSKTRGYSDLWLPPSVKSLPGLRVVQDAQSLFLYFILPALFVLATLVAPILTGVWTLITEREQDSVEMLLALPVVVDDILTAKLVAALAGSAIFIVPMFAAYALVIVTVTAAGVAYVVWSSFLVGSTLVAAAGVNLLLALWARDQRTASYYGGLLAGGPLLVTSLSLILIPGLARFVVLGLLMLFMGFGSLYAGMKWVTFERYVTSRERRHQGHTHDQPAGLAR